MKRTKGVNQELKYTIKNCVEIMAQNIRRDKLVLFCVVAILGALVPASIAYLNKKIIDAAEQMANGQTGVEQALRIVCAFIIAAMLTYVLSYARNVMVSGCLSETADSLQESIMRKCARIRLEYFDDISYRSNVDLSSEKLPTQLKEMIMALVMICSSLITIIALGITISSVNVVVAALSIVSCIPLVFAVSWERKAGYQFQKEHFEEINRQYYLHTATYRRAHLYDMRYYVLKDFVEGKWFAITKKLNREKKKLTYKAFMYKAAANCSIYFATGISLLLVIGQVLKNETTIGSVALVLSSVNALMGAVGLLFEKLGVLGEGSMYVEGYQELMQLSDEKLGMEKLGDNLEINFEDISFTYPHTEREVLHDINLTMKQGEKIAIVGENGSGKSTFVSLLSGFYPVSKGRITVNGKPIEACLKDLREKTSCLYQTSESYIMTVRENIVMGDGKREIDDKELEELGRKSGVADFIERLENGYDTVIGNLGTNNTFDLSGGQRQKMFLARALSRKNARVLIMDEPTSALDPMAEAELYRNFADLAGNRTCILISHRLGATKLADRILVFKDGRIVEEGTHESLIRQGGYYKEMYSVQAQWYQ